MYVPLHCDSVGGACYFSVTGDDQDPLHKASFSSSFSSSHFPRHSHHRHHHHSHCSYHYHCRMLHLLPQTIHTHTHTHINTHISYNCMTTMSQVWLNMLMSRNGGKGEEKTSKVLVLRNSYTLTCTSTNNILNETREGRERMKKREGREREWRREREEKVEKREGRESEEGRGKIDRE